MSKGLTSSDVVIDFSRSEATFDLIKQALKTKTPMLIGTTGFEARQLTRIKRAAETIPILLAPNTSIGVNSTLALLESAAKMLGKKADIEIVEAHHKHKLDAPSGTAIRMGETIADAIGQKFSKRQVTQSRFDNRIRKKGEIGLSSIRAGEIIGEHKVMFVLDNEEIVIEHKAHNRQCFAEGAVEAAIWLAKQKPGYYSMQDFLGNK
jgi:4-hydroxy-tetrahydrodipicolinate reductase